jgi:ferredoxin
MYVLELAYWTEGMSLDMYDAMLQLEGFAPFPELRVPKKSVRTVKSDIPEMGAGLKTMENVGMKMYGSFKGCTGCRKCEKGCPEKALTLTDKGSKKFEICVRSDLCLGTACKACETNCPERVYHFNELKVQM